MWPSGSIGRAPDFGSGGLGFKSLGGRFFINIIIYQRNGHNNIPVPILIRIPHNTCF